MPMPIEGEIGGVKKKTLLIGGAGLVVVVIGVVYMRSRKSASAQSSGMATDPAGNQCQALDPNSGYCPGTAQDLAYQSQINGTALSTDSSSYTGGQVIGYDQYGNPIYSSSSPVTGPGSYVNNAEWAQAAEAYLIQEEPNADPSAIAAALGAYITGAQVNTSQITIIQQAIAFQGDPPVPGENGDPPNINETGDSTGTTTTNVIVPNVLGKTVAEATTILSGDGFASRVNGTGSIVSQTPSAGTKAMKGSRVDLHAETKKTVRPPSTKTVPVPNVHNLTVAQATSKLQDAGFTVQVNGVGVVVSQTPAANSRANSGSRVDLHAEAHKRIVLR